MDGSVTCEQCDKQFKNKNSLYTHRNKMHRGVKRAREGPVIKADKKRVYELQCNYCEERFNTFAQLHHHTNELHNENIEDQYIQNLPTEIKASEDAVDAVRQKLHLIRRPNIITDNFEQHVFTNFGTFDTQLLHNYCDEVNSNQTTAYKVNISMSYLLHDTEMNSYRIFYAEKNNYILEKPYMVSDQTDIENLKKKLCELDLPESVCDRPSTKYRVVAILNIVFDIFKLNFVFGEGEQLPLYITNKSSVIALTSGMHGENYLMDNLCAFRALACFQNGFKQRGLERDTIANFRKWSGEYGGTPDDYPGLSIQEIPLFEELFQVNINIYSLREDDSCISIYRSPSLYNKTMYLNQYDKHLSVIKNFNAYAKKFHCNICTKHFNRHSNMKQHIKTCTDTKEIFPGGFYQLPKNIYQKLEDCGITVAKRDRHYQYFSVLDFESVLIKMEEPAGLSTKIINQHHPISVSVSNNISKSAPVCYIDEDPITLVDQLVSYLQCVQQKASQLMRERFKVILSILDTYKAILVCILLLCHTLNQL